MKIAPEILIVAPTIEQGRRIARDFLLDTKKIYSNPDMMRGYSECVVMVYAGGNWNMDKFEEFRQTIAVGNHCIIMVPEYILR